MFYEPDVDNENVNYVFETMVFGREERNCCPVFEWVRKKPQRHCWIEGRYVQIINPIQSNGEIEGYSRAQEAVNSSIIGQGRWLSIQIDERLDLMHRLIAIFQAKSKFMSHLCNINELDYEAAIDFFNFASNLSIDKWDPVGVVLVKLSPESPPWLIIMHLTSALSAGCPVILNPVPKACFFSFALAEMCEEAGLPKGLVNVVPGKLKTSQELMKLNIHKVIYNGYIRPYDFIGHKIPPNVAILTPNHTTMILLETCDIVAAVDRLFYETWRKYSKTIWAIDTLIVQESIYQEVLASVMEKIKDFPLDFGCNIRMTELLVRAVCGGAKLFYSPFEVGKMVPILLSQHHMDFRDFPVVTMMTAKTADEAINLANAGYYSIGTSIWTENYPEALTLASQLESSLVWIGCHGSLDAAFTFEPSRNSGVGIFGGLEGILENRTLNPYERTSEADFMFAERGLFRSPLKEAMRSAVNASPDWKKDKDRKKYLKDIAESMKTENLTHYVSDLTVWANMGDSYEIFKGCKRPGMQVMQNKKPIGIIVMVLTDSADPLECFTSYVSPAIAFGNVIITVTKPDIASTLKTLVDCYVKNLPAGVVNVVDDIKYASILAVDETIQAISVCTDQEELAPELQGLKKSALLNLKRFWVQSSIERSMTEYPKRFLKEQTTFMPNFESH